MRLPALLILCSFLLGGCSLQKRKYLKGFYLSRTKQVSVSPHYASARRNTVSHSSDASLRSVSAQAVDLTVASLSSDIGFIDIQRKKQEKCDTLFMRNGEARLVKVREISPDLVSYKRCDNLEGPTYSVRRADVAKIVFSTGVSETIEAPATVNVVQAAPERPVRRRTHILPVLSFVLALLSVLIPIPFATGLYFVFTIASIVMAVAGLNAIMAHPKEYKGKAWAIISLVICFLYGLIVITFLSV